MRVLVLLLAFCASAFAQGFPFPGGHTAHGGGGSNPAFVSACSDYSGSGSVSCSITSGNHLVIWTMAADTTTGHACTVTGNTLVHDLTDASNVTIGAIANLWHVATISSTATVTIACAGSTPAIMAIQYSGGTGALDTASSGTNPSTANSSFATPVQPAAFTPSNANDILVDFYNDVTGSTETISQIDTNFTTENSCTTGASCFVGASGMRVVSATASYQGGFTVSGTAGWITVTAAYK
jgi:hypothetical protein